MSWMDDALRAESTQNNNSSSWMNEALQPNNNYSGSESYQSNDTASNTPETMPKTPEAEQQTQPTYSVQQAAQQANGGQSFLNTAMTDVTGAAPVQPVSPKAKADIKTTPERDALIEEYQRISNSNAIPATRRRDEIRSRLNEIDTELGNGAMDYTLGDRTSSVLGGAVKGYGADMANAAGTVIRGMGETSASVNPALLRAQGMNAEQIRAAMEEASSQNKGQRLVDAGTKVQEKSDEWAQSSAEDINRAKNGTSGVTKFAVDIGTNAIQMGMDGLAATLTGGASLVPMFARSMGGGAREARQDGATTGQQLLYGTVKGGIEVATEKMFDGLAGIYGKGTADEAVEKLIRKLGNGSDAQMTALRTFFSGLGEAVEEGVSGAADPFTKMIYQGIDSLPKNLNSEALSDTLYSMLVGFAMGGAGGAVNIVNGENARQNSEAQANIQQANEIQNNLVQNNGMSEADSRRASEILAKMARGETITTKESAFLDSVREANGINTSATTTAEQQTPAKPSVPVPVTDESQFENRQENTQTQQAEASNPIVQNSTTSQPTVTGRNGRTYEGVGQKAQNPERAAQNPTNATDAGGYKEGDSEYRGYQITVEKGNYLNGLRTTYRITSPDGRFVGYVPISSKASAQITEQVNNDISLHAEAKQAQNEELNSNSVAENEITPEMEAAERAANADEPAPKGVEQTLQRAQERTEASQQKAQEQKANQPAQEEPQRRKIKPITENEKILSKDRTRLERENKSLRRRVENLSKQTKRTDVKTARESDVKKLARYIVGKSEVDIGETTTKLQTLADYLVQHTGETIDYTEVQRMAEEIASDIVDNSYINAESGAKEIHDELTKLIRSNTVNFGQLSAQYSMEDAKSNFPGMKFSNTKGMSVQEFYELCVSRGLVEENVVGSHEQLQAIQDSLRGTEDTRVKTFQDDADFDQAVLELQNDIIDRLLGDEVRESEPTFADKQQAKYDAMKSKLTQEVQAEREQRKADRAESRQRMEELRRDAAQRRREAVAKEKAEKYKSNQKIQEHYKNLIEHKENRRKTAAQRKKIKDLWNDLSRRVTKPTEGKYIPKELMNATIDLLQSIDTDTGSVSSAEKLNALRSAFNEVKAKPEYANILNDDVHQAMLDSLYETIGGTPLNEMSSDQLTRVHDALKALNHEIKDGVKVKLRNEERQASEVHSQMMEESKNAKGWGKGALGRMNAWYTGAFSRATTYFERLGGFKKDSAWSQMAQRLDEGQLKATNEKVRAARKFNELLTDKQSKTLRDTVNLGKDANGNDIEVSRGMMLSLKMLLDSNDGARHIKYGGVTIPGITDYYKGKNDSGFGTSQSRALGISPELADAQAEYRKLAAEYKRIDAETDKANADWQRRIDDVVARMDEKQAEIDAIYGKGDSYIDTLKGEIDKQLTDYDKKWLKTAREYFNEAQQMLNETTMEVYGFEKANVSDYFPLVTDPNFRKASFESVSRDMSLENSGFMKERTNAANPIILLDISEVIANYSDKVANYTGIMPAVRDFQKVYGKSEEGFKGSLQNTLDTKFGKDASKYIEDLMADLQGARHSQNDGLGKLLSAARGNMAQAVLTLNPRVAFSQSASYMNAASEIGWKPLMDAMSMGKNPMSDTKVMDLITKYSPLEYYRTLGNANAAMSDIQADAKWQNQMLKKFDWAMGWINMVDQHTVGRLWYASEAYVQQQGADYAKGTDEYYQEVAKVFNRVVERTQPNYTTMQRAGILRNPNELVKSMTMFMTQRLQNQNILYEAGERFAKYQSDFRDGKNGVTEADVKQARTDLTRAVTSQIASTASLVAMKAGIDAIMHSMRGYRDDDDELNAKSIAAALASNFADSFVGNFLGATELYNTYRSVFRGASYNGVTVSGIDTINTTLKDIYSAANAKTEKQLEKWGTVAKDMAQLFGIPLANAQKFVDGARKWAEDIANGEFGTFESDSNRSYLEVDFGYQPITNMFSPAINRLTQSKESRAVESEIERLYKETGIKGVYPSIRGTDSLTIDGEEHVLEGRELDKYHETAGRTAEQFASAIINSKAYKTLTDEQKAEALRTAYSYAKDLAKDEYIDAHGIETESYTTATGLLKGIDKPGDSNDRTALDEKNLGNYITYMSALKSNISAGDFSSIDKQIGWFSGMDKNLQTVLQERSSDIKRLLNYHDIGEGSETYFKMKESIVQSQINLDQSANTSAYVRLYAVADADLPESSKRKIVKDLIQGDSNFIGSHGRAAYNALESYGYTVGQTAQFFDIALHCKTWKDSGDAVDVNGQITADCLAFALQQLPGLSEGERSNIYNAVKNSVVNKFNEDNWAYKNGKQYTYKSEVDWLTNPKNKASYSTGVKISDKGSHQTSDALWAAYLSAS